MTFQESETVELKAVVVEDIKKEIIAFANCEGGKLYIGVQDDGTVSGLDDPDSVSLQVSNMVRDAIKPDLTMLWKEEKLTALVFLRPFLASSKIAGIMPCKGDRKKFPLPFCNAPTIQLNYNFKSIIINNGCNFSIHPIQ